MTSTSLGGTSAVRVRRKNSRTRRRTRFLCGELPTLRLVVTPRREGDVSLPRVITMKCETARRRPSRCKARNSVRLRKRKRRGKCWRRSAAPRGWITWAASVELSPSAVCDPSPGAASGPDDPRGSSCEPETRASACGACCLVDRCASFVPFARGVWMDRLPCRAHAGSGTRHEHHIGPVKSIFAHGFPFGHASHRPNTLEGNGTTKIAGRCLANRLESRPAGQDAAAASAPSTAFFACFFSK